MGKGCSAQLVQQTLNLQTAYIHSHTCTIVSSHDYDLACQGVKNVGQGCSAQLVPKAFNLQTACKQTDVKGGLACEGE